MVTALFHTSKLQREVDSYTLVSFLALSASAKRTPGPTVDNGPVLKRTKTPFMVLRASKGIHNS